MALYRCAACGSPNVVTDNQQQGYNYVKGAIGTAILGVGGAVAGMNGKTKTVYKCPDCGLTLNESMPLEIKTLIDIGVMSPSSRKNLQLKGVPIEWKVFTSKYKNIEKDNIDTNVNLSEHRENTDAVHSVVSTENTGDPITMDEKDRNRRVYKVARANYMKQCLEWVEKCKIIKERKSALINDVIEKEKTKLSKRITQTRDSVIAQNTATKEECEKELRKNKKKLASLGFFKFGEKKVTKDNIVLLTQKLQKAASEISNAKRNYDSDTKKLLENAKKASVSECKEIEKDHPMPKKPKKPWELYEFTKDGEKIEARDLVYATMQDDIFVFIEERGSVTYQQIKEDCSSLMDLTDATIRDLIAKLLSDYSIIKTGDKYYVNYTENPEWEVRLLFEDDMLAYEEYQREQNKKKEEAIQEENRRKNQVLEVMKGKGPVTIADIQEYSAEFNTQKTAWIMRQLAEEGIIVKTTVNHRTYYEYK